MKTLIKWLIVLIIIVGLSFYGYSNKDNISKWIDQLKPNPMAYNPYDKGQCTDYVFEKVKQDKKMIGLTWGDAKYWNKEAKKDGYQVNEHPTKGALLQSTRGKHGHVAYIEQVYPDGSLKVSEMNYIKPNKVSSRTIYPQKVPDYHYIHPKKNPKYENS